MATRAVVRDDDAVHVLAAFDNVPTDLLDAHDGGEGFGVLALLVPDLHNSRVRYAPPGRGLWAEAMAVPQFAARAAVEHVGEVLAVVEHRAADHAQANHSGFSPRRLIAASSPGRDPAPWAL